MVSLAQLDFKLPSPLLSKLSATINLEKFYSQCMVFYFFLKIL